VILVDTSVWIDFLEGKGTPQHYELRRIIENDEDICLAGIVVTEILQGIRNGRQNREIRDYLLEFPMMNPQGISSYIQAAEIYRTCARKGKTVRKTIDCLIAAVAIEHDLLLFHNDRDYINIHECCGLKIFKIGR
jgi:predicted nucleic acid-binding protein